MNIKLTQKNSVLKTAGTFCKEDINVEVDDSFVVPTGTLEITENGTHDVSAYANANVNVTGGGSEEELITWTINLTCRSSGIYMVVYSLSQITNSGGPDGQTPIYSSPQASGTYTVQAPRGIYVECANAAMPRVTCEDATPTSGTVWVYSPSYPNSCMCTFSYTTINPTLNVTIYDAD